MHIRYQQPTAWQGRIDSISDPMAFRWHQIVHPLNLNQPVKANSAVINICFLGFCCDEGVKRNLGRPGAAKGPASIRKEMANWPANCHPHAQLFDAGNITCTDSNLEEAQEALAKAVQLILEHGYFPILLGGGHEIALGHFNGILQSKGAAPAIVNFDAHLDLRPVQDKGSSGTMFNQIHEICSQLQQPFNYLCVGPQTYANTQSLFAKADEMGARYILAKEITAAHISQVDEQIHYYLHDKDAVYLTLCTDVLSAAHAPGVSAVQPFGLDPDLVLQLIKSIIKTGKVCSIDFAEVSPRFDADNRTAKLIAVYIYAVINAIIEQQINQSH
ncbi:formimidoylglutamase [Carboxylicivirga sediminis]|uniref:Formimidoylglutamase n=1 Tax=Carboxylicivirga sediminis TaxID=2006564 RepID=A0A941F6K6_9BACT|nr:formimidoylglutamase [Carboxylicivirga sediminis]MBR8537472.1 formimidoylglutamase [Carboxylicivirga sediminis]